MFCIGCNTLLMTKDTLNTDLPGYQKSSLASSEIIGEIKYLSYNFEISHISGKFN